MFEMKAKLKSLGVKIVMKKVENWNSEKVSYGKSTNLECCVDFGTLFLFFLVKDFQFHSIFSNLFLEKLAIFRRHFPKIADFSTLLHSSNLSTRCSNDFEVYLKSLDNFELWALKSEYLHTILNLNNQNKFSSRKCSMLLQKFRRAY
jgi:hypothetical protein